MLRIVALAGLMMAMAAGGAMAADSQAFEAIRTAQKVASTASLISATGERGEPQPSQWTLLYSDPQARGGVREVVVSNGEIISQRTPLTGYTGVTSQPAIKSTRLMVDSGTAFQTANKEAVAQRIGFHWVDYALRAENTTGTPEWVLKLYDYMGAQVGTVKVSAETGEVLTSLQTSARARQDESAGGTGDSGGEQKLGGVLGTVSSTVGRAATNVKNTTLRTVGTVQEVLTGERTIGPKEDE